MKLNTISFLIMAPFCLVVFSSCEDGLSTTLKVDPPEHEDLLVIDAFLDDVIEERFARVTKTYPSIDPKDLDEVLLDNASVRITENGQEILEFDAVGLFQNGFNYLALDSVEWQEGTSYTMEVDHPDYPLVTATQIFPFGAEVTDIEYIPDGGVDIVGDQISKINFTLKDVGPGDDYYSIAIIAFDPMSGGLNPIWVWSYDPLFEDDANYQELLLTDDAFNNKEYRVQLLVDRFTEQAIRDGGFIAVKSITEDYYQFNITLRSAVDGDFAGFTEPTLVHSNVEGGLGCFLLSNVEAFRIR